MTDGESWNECRNQVARYRAMAHETTDPLASRLLHDIVFDLEAELMKIAIGEHAAETVSLVTRLLTVGSTLTR